MNEGYGRFSETGERFFVTTPEIPRHWYNYFWNDRYVAFFSQVGHGEGLAQDDMGRRILFLTSRRVYLRDEETGEFWTAGGYPVPSEYEYFQCEHGIGYSVITYQKRGIRTEFRVFVPEHGTCELWTVVVKNLRETACELSVIPYIATEADGHYRPQGYNTGIGYYDRENGAAVCRAYCKYGGDRGRAVWAYLAAACPADGFDTRKNAFIGTYGTEDNPAALREGGCRDSECNSEKCCLALENRIVLKAGEKTQLTYTAGIELSEAGLKERCETYREPKAVEMAFRGMRAFFDRQNGGVWIETPDRELNSMFNFWLKHQTNLGSRWARVRHNGYRDMVSDNECLSTFAISQAWPRLKRVLSYQYASGYAPRTWIDGELQDKNFADCCVFIPMAVHSCVMESGDLSMLDETVLFNDGTAASVYEHMRRAVEFLWNFRGLHGLIKIWGGDWNDMMNQAGLKGRGVSVWLSMAWYRANALFGELAQLMGREEEAVLSRLRGAEMGEIVNRFGWDGSYYLAAYDDEDGKIGSRECREGKIYLITQLWAVMSGIAPPDRAAAVMDEVERYLETDLGTRICWPAYHSYVDSIGEMTQKPAGVHENGGVYLHTAAWKLAADAMLGRSGQVGRGLKKLLPFHDEWVKKQCEPYVMCNSYFTEETGYRYTTAGQSWRTAAGAWLVKAVISYLFGLQPEMEGLKVRPCLPPEWRACVITKRFREADYRIRYVQGEAHHRNIKIVVDGVVWGKEYLPYEPGSRYEVEVYV